MLKLTVSPSMFTSRNLSASIVFPCDAEYSRGCLSAIAWSSSRLIFGGPYANFAANSGS